MLSIGIFTYSTRPRGSVVHACALAEALSLAGHSVTLYALAKPGDELYRRLRCAVVLLPAGAAPPDPDQLIQQRVRETASGFDALDPRHDVYHAQDCLVASGLLAAERRARPLVRTVHHVERFDSVFLQECQRRSILNADAVLSVSRSAERDVLDEFGVRSSVVGNGVDASRFERRSPTALAARRARLCDARDARYVLSVGGVEPRKNSLLSLDAMSRVLLRMPDVHWVLVGGASIWEHAAYRERFQRQLAELPAPVRIRVHQLGNVSDDELTELYQVSEAVLYPSVQEGFGLCALEALAAGSPLVVSNIAPFTEYLTPDCASFVDPHSALDLERGIAELLLDAPLASSRVRAGRLHAQRYSWSRVADAHAKLYRELAERGASRAGSEGLLQAVRSR